MNTRKYLTCLLAAGLAFGAAIPAASFAADPKSYPGTMCVEAGDTHHTVEYGTANFGGTPLSGAGGNGDTVSAHTYNCSAVRENPAAALPIAASTVTVSDGSSIAGTSCYAISRPSNLNSGDKTATRTSSAALVGQVTHNLGATPAGSGYVNGVYAVVCQLPAIHNSRVSAVLSYRIDET